jgi:hypothetical protein
MVTDRELTFAPAITANELLGTKIKESKDLSLATKPLHIGHRRISPNADEFILLLDTPITRTPLFNLLSDTAPSGVLDIDGVLSDWMLRGITKALIEKHGQTLGAHWLEWERNKNLWIDVLGTKSEIPTEVGFRRVRNGELGSYFTEQSSRSPEDLLFLFTPGMEAVGGRLIQSVKSSTKGRRRSKLTNARDEVVFAKFCDWNPNTRAEVVRRFADGLSDEDWLKMMDIYSREQIEREDEDCFLERVPMSWQNLDAEAIRFQDNKGKLKYKILPETVRFRRFFKAVLGWRTRYGEDGTPGREILPSLDNDPAIVEALRPFILKDASRVVDASDPLRASAIGGSIFGWYLSPELRADEEAWPKKLGLIGHPGSQYMRAAQVPVLALKQNSFLAERAPILPAAEEYAYSHS